MNSTGSTRSNYIEQYRIASNNLVAHFNNASFRIAKKTTACEHSACAPCMHGASQKQSHCKRPSSLIKSNQCRGCPSWFTIVFHDFQNVQLLDCRRWGVALGRPTELGGPAAWARGSTGAAASFFLTCLSTFTTSNLPCTSETVMCMLSIHSSEFTMIGFPVASTPKQNSW